MSTTIPFDGDAIALIVRNKKSADDHPSLGDQHADCILERGEPIGFFGEIVASDAVNLLPLLWGPLGVPITVDLLLTKPQRIEGFVYTYGLYKTKRPHYVSSEIARAQKCISAVLRIAVSAQEAADFHACWRAMLAHPDNFAYAGNNCSTHAARAFARAGIVDAEIPGLDTPDNLYAYLKSKRSSGCSEYFGYLNFAPAPGSDDTNKAFRVETDAA